MTIYEKFLENNNLEEVIHYGNAALLFKKDGSDAWTDSVTGKGFKALSNELLFEKAYNAGIDMALERITNSPYNIKSSEPKILFNLTMNELVELIKNQPSDGLKERLKTAKTAWDDLLNSRKAEEKGS